tara:strand:- start:417 stop:563 length:147 start_codon:yes stop_codon:yes gene_type:complete
LTIEDKRKIDWLKKVLRNFHGAKKHYTVHELENFEEKLKKLEEKRLLA